MSVKTSILLVVTLISFSVVVVGAEDSEAITKLISEINAAAKTNKARMMTIIIINTDVSAKKLEQEKARTGLSLGDVYVAHSIALASRKNVDAIFASKATGQSWAQIAHAHKVSLRGSTAALKEMLEKQ
ncbi:MAG: hypothetical protein DLM73_05090 [Chthoniobacterales bacterium]|nr:MAG: hypothetical protein DLM73_05090 [Chthoniobacterales bacterium]